MPSKNGFGNSRTPITNKVSYGSAVHYKNPVKLTEGAKEKIMASDANPKFKAAISKVAPILNKKASKVKTTRTKNSITKSNGKKSSTYNIDNSKTKDNKDGSKSYTFTNDLGNSINETHGSSAPKDKKKSMAKKYGHKK